MAKRARLDRVISKLGLASRSDARRLISAGKVTVGGRTVFDPHLVVELTEGKNREIRRLCAALGHEVTRLKRIAFGSLELGDLQPGRWREATADEIARLRQTAGASSAQIRSTTLKR